MTAPSGLLEELLHQRYSCRAFLDTPISAELVREALRLAQRTASWSNTQPWQVHLVGPGRVGPLSELLLAVKRDGEPDLELPRRYDEVAMARRRATGFALYGVLGIAREDHAARSRQLDENFRFFGAPHVAIVHIARDMGAYGAVDAGGYVATLMLALRSLGIDSIAQGALAQTSGPLREFCGISPSRAVVCGVAFGYADPDHAANGLRTERAELGEVVTWLD